MTEYKGVADVSWWEAKQHTLTLHVVFKPMSVNLVYTRYWQHSSYNNSKWYWSQSDFSKSNSERSPLRNYSGGEHVGLPEILDSLVLSHEELRSIAKLYGYTPDDNLRDSLDKVLEKSAS